VLFSYNEQKEYRTMEDFQESPADQLVAVLMGEGEPEYIPDEVKSCFCKFNNVYISKNNNKDNFFYVVIKKYLTQLCTNKNIYLKKLERFPVKNLKYGNVYLATYTDGTNTFNCYFINRQGEVLLEGGGELYSILEDFVNIGQGCVKCNFNKRGCEYCDVKLIEKIIQDVPSDYVEYGKATFDSFNKLFGNKEIDVIVDFMNYYIRFCRSEVVVEKTNVNKVMERSVSNNPTVEKLLSQLERLDPKIIDSFKSFLIDLFAQNGKIEEVTEMFRGCSNVEETMAYLCQLLIRLHDAVIDVKNGDDEKARSMMDLFLLDFFESTD
jgi:hypothetical protein